MVPEYNKLYQRARAQAVRDLIDAHREDFARLLHEYKHQLALSHRHPDEGHQHEG